MFFVPTIERIEHNYYTATVDEHHQKVGAEAFNRFQRCAEQLLTSSIPSDAPPDV